MAVEILPLEKMKERVGDELGVTDWLEIDQDRIDKFADCTLDHQWIHIDKEAAAKGPFGKTIAHGYLTVSLLSHFSEGYAILPEGTMMAVNYGMNKLRLINPVPVGSKIRDRIAVTDVVEKEGGRILVTTTHTVEIEGQEKPACVAEVLSMFFTS
ncbi:MAG: MaoC family dehydratase [Deltaproteobacteria bacterium]|nr:MaoC family dehydratase [Deltaproteobacteria bacterium]